MKKFYSVFIVLLFGFFTAAYAQQGQNKLFGIWQMCSQVVKKSGEKVMACSPIWKVLNKDGTFTQFMLAHKDGMCAITHEGTYQVVSDKVYKEHILRHAIDPRMVDAVSTLSYRFVNDDMIELTFKLKGEQKEQKEVWKRVKIYPSPAK